MDEHECSRRNALFAKPAALMLEKGTLGTVVEILDDGQCYLVEFGSRGAEECDWLGVLRRSEVEFAPEVACAASNSKPALERQASLTQE